METLKNLYHILKNSFLTCYCIISKPILEFTPNKMVIKLFYYDFSKFPLSKREQALLEVLDNKSIKGIKGFNFTDKNNRMSILQELEFLCINLSKLMKT